MTYDDRAPGTRYIKSRGHGAERGHDLYERNTPAAPFAPYRRRCGPGEALAGDRSWLAAAQP